jgi:lipoic acid synthetase
MSQWVSMQVDYSYLESLSVDPILNPRTGVPLKPRWLKVDKVHGDRLYGIKRALRTDTLHTVCEEAKCPNISECWNVGTATFMVLGDTCTRGCRFCAVKTGNPGGLVDEDEPAKVAANIAAMALDYAVITMVDRDDLDDGGAGHVAAVIQAVQQDSPGTRIEILAGDFLARAENIAQILDAGTGLDVFAHNLETVQRLTPRVRDARASYKQSLKTLELSKALRPATLTKSAIMLGLGEDYMEVEETLRDMRNAGVEIVTIGQYLQPTRKHLRIKRFVHPLEFDYWRDFAQSIGFRGVASGPLVRSSYKASHLFPGAVDSKSSAVSDKS